jgi:hypothetical protein
MQAATGSASRAEAANIENGAAQKECGNAATVSALDVGASPGGWSYQLAAAPWVESVVAVDPGAMASPMPENVVHLKKRIQDCGNDLKGRQLHLYVNDMNASPTIVLKCFLAARPLLCPGAAVCLTLKSFCGGNVADWGVTLTDAEVSAKARRRKPALQREGSEKRRKVAPRVEQEDAQAERQKRKTEVADQEVGEAGMSQLRFKMRKACEAIISSLKAQPDACDVESLQVLHLMSNGLQERCLVFRLPRSVGQ